MIASQFRLLRDIVEDISETYLRFLREEGLKDRRETRIIFYESMRQVFEEDPLSDAECQAEVIYYLREKLSSAADPFTDKVKRHLIEQSKKRGTT